MFCFHSVMNGGGKVGVVGEILRSASPVSAHRHSRGQHLRFAAGLQADFAKFPKPSSSDIGRRATRAVHLQPSPMTASRHCVSRLTTLPRIAAPSSCSALPPSCTQFVPRIVAFPSFKGSSPTRNPLAFTSYHQHRTHLARRPFSTTFVRHGGKSSPQRAPNMRTKAQPAMSVALKKQQAEALQSGEMLQMLGILEGTFIMPTGRRLPDFYKDPKARFELERRRIMSMVTDFVGNQWTAYFALKPRLKLEPRSKVVALTKKWYTKMYTAFAAGDLTPMQDRIAKGFQKSLRLRIGVRKPNTRLHWRLEKYLEEPRVVSYRVQAYPLEKGEGKDKVKGIVQAVVRMRTVQTLQESTVSRKVDRKSGQTTEIFTPIDTKGKPLTQDQVAERRQTHAKETLEYVVLQKYIMDSKPGEWMIWGTAEESTPERLKEMDERSRRMLKLQLEQKKIGLS